MEQLQKLKTHREECIKQTGVDQEVVDNARKGNVVDNPKLQEHLLCMFKRIGFMDDAGKIQKDVLKKKLVDVIKEEELANKLIEVCATEAATPQLTAFENFKCFFGKTGLPVA